MCIYIAMHLPIHLSILITGLSIIFVTVYHVFTIIKTVFSDSFPNILLILSFFQDFWWWVLSCNFIMLLCLTTAFSLLKSSPYSRTAPWWIASLSWETMSERLHCACPRWTERGEKLIALFKTTVLSPRHSAVILALYCNLEVLTASCCIDLHHTGGALHLELRSWTQEGLRLPNPLQPGRVRFQSETITALDLALSFSVFVSK